MIHLVIEDHLPPSLNSLLRSHWAVRKRMKEEWTALVWGAWMEGYPQWVMLPPEEYGKREVQLAFYFRSQRRRDADNYQKIILDALVASGLIKDDSPEWVDVQVSFHKDAQRPRTEIVIKEGFDG